MTRYTFETHYEEGAVHPKVMTVAPHCRVAGRAALAHVVDMFLAYTRSLGGIASSSEVPANWR